MNGTGLGLALGAGYLLGRTKKMKLALAVGTLAAGKKMNLTPKGIVDTVTTQLGDNPQLKEMGDQLRTDLRGVGKAASGAMVERQVVALADRLHGRTAAVREQLAGEAAEAPDAAASTASEVVSKVTSGRDVSDASKDTDTSEAEAAEGTEETAGDEEAASDEKAAADEKGAADEETAADEKAAKERGGGRREPRHERAGKKARPESRKTAKRAPATKSAAKAPGKAPGRASGKSSGKKAATGRAQQSKGGEER